MKPEIRISLLLAVLALSGCAGIPPSIGKIDNQTIETRAALHDLMIRQAVETLREARDWQHLNDATLPVQTPAPADSVLMVPKP